MRRNLIMCLLLAGVTLALYWPAARFGLVYYDDPLFLTESPEIQSGLNWQSFHWACTSVIIANWHPVTTLSFVIDHQLFGTNPGAEHRVNILFHTVNTVLLFLLLTGLTGSGWRSALVAAVFAWHPLRVESVAWITERKDVLSGFFFLLTLGFYAQSAKTTGPKSKVFHGASLGALALGLMSKPMLVTVPLVLLLLDVWPLKRMFPGGGAPPGQPWQQTLAGLVGEKWAFIAVSALFCVLTYLIQKNYAAEVPLNQLGWNYRIANAITSYGRYFAKLFWPANLAAIYPYQRLDDWLAPGLIALGLAMVTGICIRQFQRRPWLAVGWFWYLATCLPIIGLVQVGGASMADRYTYLTLIGPVIALVWSIPEAWTQPLSARVIWGGGIAAGLGALVVLTHVQIEYWRDTISLFAHTLAVTGDNPGAESGLGYGLEHAGQPDQALVHYRRALALSPGEEGNYLKVSRILTQQSQWAEATDDLVAALNLEPNDATAHENLAAILPHLGRNAEAVQHWEAALRLTPDATDALNNFAWLLATCPDPAVRDGQRAVLLAEQACELTRHQTTVCLGTLAAAYAEAGRFEEAIATAQKACDNAAARGETQLLQRNQDLLTRYRNHQAYHEPADQPASQN